MLDIKINESYISDLFRSMARQKGVSVKCYCDNKKYYAVILFTDRKGDVPFLKIISEDYLNIEEQSIVTISCLYKNIYLKFNTTITKIEDDNYFILKPIEVLTRLDRLIYRYYIEDETCFITFNSFDYVIKDISGNGVSFVSPTTNGFKENSVIKNVILHLSDKSIIVDLAIKHINKCEDTESYILGAEFFNYLWNDFYTVFQYVFNKMYPSLKNIVLYKEEEIFELYKKSGYLAIKNDAGDGKFENFENMINILPLIQIPQISSNLVFVNEENRILSGASVIRIYNNTFMSQHLASIPESRHNLHARTDIYSALNDFLLNNPYFKYYIAYFYLNVKWHKEFYQKIGSYIGDVSKFCYEEMNLYWFNIDEFNQGNSELSHIAYSVELLTDPKEFLNFCNYSNNISPLEAEVYCYDENSINLNEIKGIYEIIGLYVARNIWKVSTKISGGNDLRMSVAYIVGESYTSGLNLSNVIDSVRIYFKKVTEQKDIFLSALPEILKFFYKFNKNQFSIFYKRQSEYDEVISGVPGLSNRIEAGRVIANRLGGSEYRNIFNLNMR